MKFGPLFIGGYSSEQLMREIQLSLEMTAMLQRAMRFGYTPHHRSSGCRAKRRWKRLRASGRVA
jgi:hypothetical protein